MSNVMKHIKEFGQFINEEYVVYKRRKGEDGGEEAGRYDSKSLANKMKDKANQVANNDWYVLEEGLMGDVHQLVKDTKTVQEFVKRFFAEYGDKIKRDRDSEEWVKGLYADAKNESLELNEADAFDALAGELSGTVYDAYSDGKTISAYYTPFIWPDGVPVLKYMSRSGKKTVKLPKQFKIVEDENNGWWYFKVGNTWYGIDQDDYGTPPFEY